MRARAEFRSARCSSSTAGSSVAGTTAACSAAAPCSTPRWTVWRTRDVCARRTTARDDLLDALAVRHVQRCNPALRHSARRRRREPDVQRTGGVRAVARSRARPGRRPELCRADASSSSRLGPSSGTRTSGGRPRARASVRAKARPRPCRRSYPTVIIAYEIRRASELRRRRFRRAAGRRPFLDVYNPSSGDVISRVPLSGRGRGRRRGSGGARRVSRLVGDADQRARPGLLSIQGAARAEHRRARGAGHRRERQDRERSARRSAQVGRADGVRLLAAADHAGRSARGEPRRRVSRRAISARRRRVDRAVQLSEHGAQLDDPERDRAGQLHDSQAVGARADQRRANRRAAARSGTAGGRVSGRARRTGGGRSDLRSSRTSRR